MLHRAQLPSKHFPASPPLWQNRPLRPSRSLVAREARHSPHEACTCRLPIRLSRRHRPPRAQRPPNSPDKDSPTPPAPNFRTRDRTRTSPEHGQERAAERSALAPPHFQSAAVDMSPFAATIPRKDLDIVAVRRTDGSPAIAPPRSRHSLHSEFAANPARAVFRTSGYCPSLIQP